LQRIHKNFQLGYPGISSYQYFPSFLTEKCEFNLSNLSFVSEILNLYKHSNFLKDGRVSICHMWRVVNWCQFHQHFTYKFFVRTSFRQLFSTYVRKKICRKDEKFERIMLMKFTPGWTTLISTKNVLCCMFVILNPKLVEHFLRGPLLM